MTSEREVYSHIQLPGTMQIVPAAVLRVLTLGDGTRLGRFRYGDRYLDRAEAVAFDPFKLPLTREVVEFTALKGIPGAVRDAWGRRVIEYRLGRPPEDFDEIDYLLNGPQDGAGCLSFGLNAQPPAPVRACDGGHPQARHGALRAGPHFLLGCPHRGIGRAGRGRGTPEPGFERGSEDGRHQGGEPFARPEGA